MKVKDLIKQLEQTGMNNEVRLINTNQYDNDHDEEYTDKIYVSFDDNNDVVLFEG